MTIYKVSGKWCYTDLDKAIEKAKNWLKRWERTEPYIEYRCQNDWKIKKDRNGNYIIRASMICDKDSYYNFTSQCIIRVIETED